MSIEKKELILSSQEVAGFLKKILEKGIPFKFTAIGNSMSPFICNGDSLIIEPAKEKNKAGDIAAVINPDDNKLIIHRVIDIKKNRCLIKGDNVLRCDGYYEKKYIIGYVKKVIFVGKKYKKWNKKFRNIILIFNNNKKIIAFLSKYNILTYFCKIANRIIL